MAGTGEAVGEGLGDGAGEGWETAVAIVICCAAVALV